MGRSRHKILQPELPHFITSTVVGWLPIFRDRSAAQIVFRSLRFLHEQRGAIFYAYVLMDTHLHCVIQCENLITVLRSFKSYTARAIIDHLKNQEDEQTLVKLQAQKLRHKSETVHQLWQEGNHPQGITSLRMMQQVISYIHYNPVRDGYVSRPEDWPYSSACSDEEGEGLVKIVKGL